MKLLLALLIASAVCSAASLRPGLRVKFDVGLRPGRNFFFDIPRHVDDAIASNWTQEERPPSPLPSLVMYCPSETVICTLYDHETRYIGGLQIALPLNEFSGAGLDWKEQGFIPWKRPGTNDAESVTYMTKQLYFISEATLSKSKEERMKAAEANIILQEDAVWPMGFNQQLMEVPTNTAGIINSGFTKQACIPWMGQHYYYKMSAKTKCTAKDLLTWFPLVDSGKLIAMGFVVIGALPQKAGEKFYFEQPPKLAVQTIVPRGPKCLYELAENPTLTTMHIYFIDEPWKIGCWPFSSHKGIR